MKKSVVGLLVMLMILLAACSTPTETPTEAPAVETPAESGSIVDSREHTPDPLLTNKTWMWERRDPNGNQVPEIIVPNPENYTLFFNDDGTFNATIDCNSGSGRYATTPPGSIFMELGPMTQAACPDGSLSGDMINMFGPAQNYRFEEDNTVLVFVWVAGGPVDYYRTTDAQAGGDTTESIVASREHTPDPLLTNKTWMWERRDPNGNPVPEIVIPDPENYTLFFNEDGTFNAKIDCNNGSGAYATNPPGGIFMELGPMTMAACPDGSASSDMINMFGPAQDYRFEEDNTVLVFVWVAGGPIDYYRNASVDLPEPAEDVPTGTVTAPDGIFLRTGPGTDYPYVGVAAEGDSGEIIGVSTDGQWWLVAAPNLPGGQVWASAEFVSTTGTETVPVVAAPPQQLGLIGIAWEWVVTTNPTGDQEVNDPSRYVILFKDDSTANIKADCNNVQATYTALAGNINIETGPSTMVACPAGSLADTFLSQLNSASIYFIEGGNLYLDLPADSGTMRFVPQGTPPPSPDAPAGGGDGSTFYLTSFGPQGAQQAVLAGTQITANFSGTQLSGSAGCNNYSATLTPVDTYFTVSNIITTRMVCSEPAGVMEQEQAYLTALAGVDGYVWTQQGGSAIATGQLFYTLADGTTGVMNFTTSP
ncbi:MAG: META domain-containing protein [Anaerolineae bacterium]|nr:META domain-containing protein [Anaerolineae bacterium]